MFASLADDYKPKRIIQIVSGSRSGSSLLKSLLAASPSLSALAGEEEPYYVMTGNGYGMNSTSEEFSEPANPVLFRRLLHTELTTFRYWEWRLCLQYTGATLARLLNDVEIAYRRPAKGWLTAAGVIGHYDGCTPEQRLPFQVKAFEMPPFVIPKPAVRGPLDVLLLKNPYDAYRAGVLEKIFPGVQIARIILTRNPGATINGLIDGWQAPYGFHKHLTPYGWWKFDMPPTWERYVEETTATKAWAQWQESYTRILRDYLGVVIKFEELLAAPEMVLNRLCNHLGIVPPPSVDMPLVMSTAAPVPGRWRARAAVIEPLLERSKELIAALGYSDRSSWL